MKPTYYETNILISMLLGASQSGTSITIIDAVYAFYTTITK